MTKPTDAELLAEWDRVSHIADAGQRRLACLHAVLVKWGTPQQEAQEPCPTCIALARTVMLDHVSFDRKPDCYGIRQITDDEGVEEWEDIRTSPDVAREEANDMMATGRGEIYEVVPLWTTPQPTQAGAVPLTDGQAKEVLWSEHLRWMRAAGLDTDGMCPTGEWLDHWLTYVRAIERAHGIGIKGGQHVGKVD